MADKAHPIGPWPAGVNNVDDESSELFTNRGPEQPAALRAAVNVDITRLGDIRRRIGRTKIIQLSEGHSLFSDGDELLLVSNGNLSGADVDLHSLEVKAGVGADRLSYVRAAGQTWFGSKTVRGRLTNGNVSFWGLKAPIVSSVTQVPGSMAEGSYLVAVTVESDGVESGAAMPFAFSLSGSGGITVDVTNVDPNAESINVYVSTTNGRDVFFHSNFAVGATLLCEGPPSTTDAMELYGLQPPPPVDIVRVHSGRLLISSGNVLYWSQPLGYHHFKMSEDFQLFDSTITMLEPMLDGIYIGTEKGVWWLSGNDPHDWSPKLLSKDAAPQCSASRVPGNAFPSLDYNGVLIVWSGAKGFLAGQPGGRITMLTENRVAMDMHKTASVVYREQDGIRQVLMAAKNKARSTQFGATDSAECDVIRASTGPQL